MTNTLNSTWGSRTTTANTTQFWCIFGAWSALSTTETDLQILMRSAGTLSNMWIRITANSIVATPSMTFTSRVDAAPGNQIVTPGSTATGVFTDSMHTDTLAAGAKVGIMSVPGATTNTVTSTLNSFIFAATTNTVTRLGSNSGDSSLASTTKFEPLVGNISNAGGYALETTGAKARQRKAGTFQNLCINVVTNAGGTTTLTSRVNGGAGVQTISVASSTGFLEDTIHMDSVAAGDDFNEEFVIGTGQVKWSTISVDFSSTTNDCEIINAVDTPPTVLINVTTNYGLGGSTTTTVTELNTEGLVGNAFVWSNLTILVTTNTASATSTLTLRVGAGNAGSPAVQASITASTPNVYSDTTHTYTSATTDLMNTQLFVGNAGTSLKFSNIIVWATGSAAVIVSNPRFFTTKTDLRQLNPAFSNAPILMST